MSVLLCLADACREAEGSKNRDANRLRVGLRVELKRMQYLGAAGNPLRMKYLEW
jgi:hypothetical protein